MHSLLLNYKDNAQALKQFPLPLDCYGYTEAFDGQTSASLAKWDGYHPAILYSYNSISFYPFRYFSKQTNIQCRRLSETVSNAFTISFDVNALKS